MAIQPFVVGPCSMPSQTPQWRKLWSWRKICTNSVGVTNVQTTLVQEHTMGFYVSVTGFRPKRLLSMPAFLWRTLASLQQARKAPGIVRVTARVVDGTYHTMTVWIDKTSMHRFVTSGAHRGAMKNFRLLGSGKTCGYESGSVPDWQSTYEFWRRHAKEI